MEYSSKIIHIACPTIAAAAPGSKSHDFDYRTDFTGVERPLAAVRCP
jgi:hypothetical protein